jgi:hypothetical protein
MHPAHLQNAALAAPQPIRTPLIVGQTVHYWPFPYEQSIAHDQPFAAVVCHINDNSTVNLCIKNEIGIELRRINVVFPRDRAPQKGEASFART